MSSLLERLNDLARRATPAPWGHESYPGTFHIGAAEYDENGFIWPGHYITPDGEWHDVPAPGTRIELDDDDGSHEIAQFVEEEDREFIVALVNAWPAIREVLEAAQDLERRLSPTGLEVSRLAHESERGGPKAVERLRAALSNLESS